MRSGLSNETPGGPSCINLCQSGLMKTRELVWVHGMNCPSSFVHFQREAPCMETLTKSAWTSGGNFYGDPHMVSVQAQLTLRLGPLQAHSSVGCCFGEIDVNCNILLLLEAKSWGREGGLSRVWFSAESSPFCLFCPGSCNEWNHCFR